ncbi:MAG: hypothetical protein HND44_18295 [Chloroflexi bacterium]|nr:hypothetical protein [Ardenticatenaceae bacterium]MBL1130408.1 hypothetical protein [Chloroflexota bacterium]NOG36499.1 hypothetical protein [Chloroflexota bacterium]
MAPLQNTVGLFGTAGNSTWRNAVMARLDAAGIAYFNPVVPDWTPAHAELESQHLASDRVILLVITAETEGYGSLAETGWAALSAAQNGQAFLLVIEDYPDGPKSAANRARALVRAHAQKAGMTVYDDVDTAVTAAIEAIRKP